ncbi:MFS transporter [Chondromyces crocatus]|uniref:MFS transporter n=1 Tax=Chondromyces crocatus TaxID=52 RepID=A0A0K1EH91_CHOCO|nr:MFS transporter [Chondromyces crocatus]AKT40230.1 MFS transporter [Chondromyces crocatus]
MSDALPRRAGLPLALLAALALSTAIAPLNSTMIAVALPEMARTLPADSSVLRQGLVTSYMLTNIVLQSPGGKLGDRIGHRRGLELGQLIFALGAALAYLMPYLPALIISRVLMATGAAVMTPSAMAMLRTELPTEARARAFGAFGALIGISAALGPKIGALLVARFGWISIFLANVPVLLASALLRRVAGASASSPRPTVARASEPTAKDQPSAPNSQPSTSAPESAAQPLATAAGQGKGTTAPAPFDLVGSFLLGASLIGLVLGMENAPLRWAALLGMLGLIPFALWERRVSDPVIDFSLFRRRAFLAGTLIVALQSVAMYSVMFELPQVASRLFSSGKQDVGNTLVVMMGAMVVTSPLGGRASERFGARAVAMTGSLLNLTGMILLGIGRLDSLTDAMPALALLGAGFGLVSAPTQSAAMSDVPRHKSGMAAGVSSTMRYVGGIAGVSMLGLLLSERTERDVVMREHTTVVTLFCIAFVLQVLCTLLLPRRTPPLPPR